MKVLTTITLENEMDLMLAHQKTSRICELLELRSSTKTTFVTALSEIVRVIIEYTDKGVFSILLLEAEGRYLLSGRLIYEEEKPGSGPQQADFIYAKKLVPVFEMSSEGRLKTIEFSIGIPRHLELNSAKIEYLSNYIEEEMPVTPYEALKNRQTSLAKLAEVQDKKLQESDNLNNLKNEFLAIVSHELETPLTIIAANAQIALSSKMTDVADMQKFVKSIYDQCGKLSYLVDQLLDTAKAQNGKLTYTIDKVDFNDYVEELMIDLRYLAPDHSFTIKLGNSHPAKLDKLRIQQVFANLISNAAKYSEKGTSISIKTSMRDNNLILIEVTDAGIGMSETTLSNVFEKFYRDAKVMKQYAGLGMGMYISSKIVQDHGGSIWAESTPQVGTTFYFTLPSC